MTFLVLNIPVVQLAVAKAEANRKNSAWTKAHAKLNQKKKDVAKERADLKVMFESGNGMKAGEIAMIVKIRCMYAAAPLYLCCCLFV